MSRISEDSFISPASFGQQRLWFLSKLDEVASRAYHLSCCFEIDGALNSEALQSAIDVLVHRQEALRTTFTLVDEDELRIGDQLCQVIAPTAVVPLENIDLRESSAGEHFKVVADWTGRAFDLEQGPLLRVATFRTAAARQLLVLTMHHIISDGWSVSVMCQELVTAYQAAVKGREPALPKLPVQYADFAEWQRDLFDGPEYDRQLSYWRQTLRGLPAVRLPTDHPRPPNQTFRGGRMPVAVAPDLVASLEELARAESATLYMIVLAAWEIVLGQYARQRDFGVGVATSGRGRPELQRVVGFFVNTIVLRTDLGSDQTFRQLLRRVRVGVLHAFEHQDVPFDRLVQQLVTTRDPSRSPLFQVMFSFQDAPQPAFDLEDLRLTPRELLSGTAMFDMRLDLFPRARGLTGWIEYNSDLFEPETVGHLATELQALLAGVGSDPDQPTFIEEREAADLPPTVASHAERRREGPLLEPRTEMEVTVANSFKKYLRLENIDIRDSFFTLGGNSLLAVRMLTELRKSLGITLPIELIFNLTSVERLAADLVSPPAAPEYPDADELVSELDTQIRELGQ
jgi:acyl carrier protein